MKLFCEELSVKSLQGIGKLLSSSTGSTGNLKPEDAFSCSVISSELGLGAGLSAGQLDCQARDLTLRKLERHLQTPELLFSMDGDSVICVAPPQEPLDGELKGLKALHVSKGQSLILDAGSWHWIPFPTAQQAARFLVIFRATTGEDDLHFCALTNPLNLELAH